MFHVQAIFATRGSLNLVKFAVFAIWCDKQKDNVC